MQIVGLMGYERAGKSTAAKFLRDHGFETASFASVLKRMLDAGFDLGHEALHGGEKETPHPALGGATPRHAMQTLGTEWGRKLIHDDIWVEAFKRDLESRESASPGGRYLVEDVRYANEVRAIRELGGEIWVIRRPSVEPLMSWRHNMLRRLRLKPKLHTSSTGWSEIKDAERTIWNIGSRQAFEEEVRNTHNVWRALRFWKQGDRPFDNDALMLVGVQPVEPWPQPDSPSATLLAFPRNAVASQQQQAFVPTAGAPPNPQADAAPHPGNSQQSPVAG